VICGDRFVASEVAQEAFAVAMGSWPRVSAMEHPGAWIRRVAVNRALKERARREDLDPEGLRRAEQPADDEGLGRAIRELPAKQRLAVVLHHFHDLSLGEVADTLGCAASTASVHLRRAHQSLGTPDGGDALSAEVKKVVRDEYLAVAEVIPSEPVAAVAWRRPTMVFVTSPALGANSLAPTVDAMAALGYDTAQVDLSDLADLPLPRWRAAAGRIAATVYAASGPVVLVGHGQAGPLLLPVADLRRVVGLILIDTALPPMSGTAPALPPGLVEALADSTVDGRLPPWETWWPQCALEFVVEDDELRRRLRDELPAVPASYGEEEIPVADRWRSLPAGYLRLSLVRESEATFAGMRGLAAERLSGNHLLTATEPTAVASKLVALMDALEPAMI
jgi:RNA polymerase sigma factor (sigma-70 family)